MRVRGNWCECGVYCGPVGPEAPGRPAGSSRLPGCLVTSLVRLELLVLDVGGEPLQREGAWSDPTHHLPQHHPCPLPEGRAGQGWKGAHPACCMCTPLLVGLAGAD